MVLITVALKLKTTVRPNDTVARLGGDEFIILLDNLQEDRDPSIVARRILDGLDTPFCIKGKELKISCSIGIEMGDHKNLSAEGIVRNADIAMYHVKNGGKSGFCYYVGNMKSPDGSLR